MRFLNVYNQFSKDNSNVYHLGITNKKFSHWKHCLNAFRCHLLAQIFLTVGFKINIPEKLPLQ